MLCMTTLASAEESSITWFNTNKTITLTNNGDAAATAKQGKSDVKELQYSVNGGSFAKYTAGFTLSAEGENTIIAKSIDNAGNETTSTAKIYIDKTKPVLTTEGNPTQWCKSATITAKAADALSGIKNISNGTAYVTGDTITLEVNELGDYTFTTTDNANNQTSKTETVTKIDNLPPLAPTININ